MTPLSDHVEFQAYGSTHAELLENAHLEFARYLGVETWEEAQKQIGNFKIDAREEVVQRNGAGNIVIIFYSATVRAALKPASAS